MATTTEPTRPYEKVTVEAWVRRACTLLVAGVAAYASYQHQRGFAREGGSDPVEAVLWSLAVDGLSVLATVGVLTSTQRTSRRYRIAVWLSFWAGIAMSLTANISAAPELTLQSILVAGWPLRRASGAVVTRGGFGRYGCLSGGVAVVAATMSSPRGRGVSGERGPRRAVPFLDRSVQRATIRDHLVALREQREPGLICVHGRAGLGSYSLAAEACGELLQTLGGIYIEVQAAMADGRPVPLGEVLGQALRGLGVAEADLAVTDEARAEAYQRLSAGRRFVLLVKDAVVAEQIAPLVPSSAPDALVLVTSRRALRALYARNFIAVQLDRLPAEEAHELLISSLGPTAAEIDSGLVEELDRLCDGHPLLIRLVAAHLLGRARVAEPLVTRIRRSRAALLELDATLPVTSSLTLAYEGLKEPLQRAYRRAALVPGPDLTPDVVAIACAVDELTAAEMLDELVDANLLSVDETSGRYTFHTVVREHARLRAREDEGDERCDAVAGRIARWYLDEAVPRDAALTERWRVGAAFAVSDRPRPPRDQAIEWFDREWRTVVACVDAAHRAAEHDVAWQLCVAVFKYLHMHGHTDAWLETHRLGVESARHVGDLAGVMQVTNQRGAAWMAVHAFPNARADFDESLAAALEIGHSEGQQSNLEWLGKLSARESDVDAAFVRYDESETVIADARPPIAPEQAARMLALLNLHRARAHLLRGARPEAVATVTRALDHFHAGGGERENRAKCLSVLGDAVEDRPAAADAHDEAAALYRADGLRRAEAGALLRVGQLAEDPPRARAALQRSCELYAELGDPEEDKARAALDQLGAGPT